MGILLCKQGVMPEKPVISIPDINRYGSNNKQQTCLPGVVILLTVFSGIYTGGSNFFRIVGCHRVCFRYND
jgi:hypothetical protein